MKLSPLFAFCIFCSFDSLPGSDDLNSYDMPHPKKLVNAKEAFKVWSFLCLTACTRWYNRVYSTIDPFFSANIRPIKKLKSPYYRFSRDLSRNTGLKKIEKLFRTNHRGQRSNMVILCKIRYFQVILSQFLLD